MKKDEKGWKRMKKDGKRMKKDVQFLIFPQIFKKPPPPPLKYHPWFLLNPLSVNIVYFIILNWYSPGMRLNNKIYYPDTLSVLYKSWKLNKIKAWRTSLCASRKINYQKKMSNLNCFNCICMKHENMSNFAFSNWNPILASNFLMY